MRIAILIPCFNEAPTVGRVVADFRRLLPGSVVHVFDNDSSDDTAEVSREAGAKVHRVRLRGKGQVVRRQFADVEADVYLLIDGDGTYSVECASRLIEQVIAGHDMVVGTREATDEAAYRRGHATGNRLLTGFLAWLFGRQCRDILSGYRAFSRRFVKSFPAHSTGFEIETELTVHALEMRMAVAEVPTPYGGRPEGSLSKLSTWRDGMRILKAILGLFSTERPIACYGTLGLALATISMVLSVPLFYTYFQTGLVPRFPTAILASALMLLSALSVLVGIVLDSVARGRREAKTFAYLSIPGPAVELEPGDAATLHR